MAQDPRPAPPDTATPDGDATAARAAHERGLDARDRSDWQAAYEAFLGAWGHKHHWEIAVNLGEMEMKLGKYEDALAHLSFAVNEPGFLQRSPDLVSAERKQISDWSKEAESKLEERRRAAAAARPEPKEAPPANKASPRTWAWITGALAGVSVAGVVSGGALFAMAGGKAGEVKDSLQALPGKAGDPASVRCAGAAASTCHTNEEKLRSADSMQSAGTGLFVTAGAVAAAAVVLTVLWPKRSERAPVVAPSAGAGSAGLVLSAAW